MCDIKSNYLLLISIIQYHRHFSFPFWFYGWTLGFENKKLIYATLSCSCVFFLYILGKIIWIWHIFQNMYSQCTWINISFQNESGALPYLETEGYIIQHFLAKFSLGIQSSCKLFLLANCTCPYTDCMGNQLVSHKMAYNSRLCK